MKTDNKELKPCPIAPQIKVEKCIYHDKCDVCNTRPQKQISEEEMGDKFKEIMLKHEPVALQKNGTFYHSVNTIGKAVREIYDWLLSIHPEPQAKPTISEEELNRVFEQIKKEAYNPELHAYDFKYTNQFLRKYLTGLSHPTSDNEVENKFKQAIKDGYTPTERCRSCKFLGGTVNNECYFCSEVADTNTDHFEPIQPVQGETRKGLKHGLYIVFWKEGGISLASIGYLSDGTNWMAPSNWTNPDKTTDFSGVEKLHLLYENVYGDEEQLEFVKSILNPSPQQPQDQKDESYFGDCSRLEKAYKELQEQAQGMSAEEWYRKRYIELAKTDLMRKVAQVADITMGVRLCKEYHEYASQFKQPKQSEWISVEDGLPEKVEKRNYSKPVTICTWDEKVIREVCYNFYHKSWYKNTSEAEEIYGVVCWMIETLPQPPNTVKE